MIYGTPQMNFATHRDLRHTPKSYATPQWIHHATMSYATTQMSYATHHV